MKNTANMLSVGDRSSVQKAIRQLRSRLGRSRLKWSLQREHIVTAFLTRNHVTIRSLYAALNKPGQKTPLGSIYRTMRVLCAMEFAQPRNFGDETLYDNIWAKGEHDHLICTRCGHIVEFDNPAIERLREKVFVANGFSVATRNFELYGICSPCRDAMAPSRSHHEVSAVGSRPGSKREVWS